MTFESSRTFQLWEYRVSLGSLLIRSPQSLTEDTNIDLIFTGVRSIACNRYIRGLALRVVPQVEVRSVLGEIQVDPPAKVFELRSGDFIFTVIASACLVYENEYDMFESPFA